MKQTYADLMKQISNLQVEAERLRSQEVEEVIEKIKVAIDAYGLTAKDLGFGAQRPGRKGAGDAGKKREASVKYQDKKGNTWGGMGPRPKWLKDELAQGKSLESFKV